MPLQLTTAIDVGDLDSHDYTHVMITDFYLDTRHRAIQVATAEGYLVDGTFVRGEKSRDKRFEIMDIPERGVEGEPGHTAADPQYSDMAGETYGHNSKLLYDDVATALYQWMVDQGHYAGTIV